MNKYLRLLRVKHYFKNLLIFAPLFFDNKIFVLEYLKKTFAGFVSFCLASSFIYILNDIKDVNQDRYHQTKCKRPIASGQISINQAKIIMIAVAILSILISYFTNILNQYIYVLIYILLNVFYSCYGGKNIPIMDIVILSSGFVIRILYGASICDVAVSDWLYLTVFSGALFLSMGKRKREYKYNLIDQPKEEQKTRKVLNSYTFAFLDRCMYVLA